MFVDSHAHIDGPEFDSDRAEIIQRARDAGVSAILNIGTGDPQTGVLERAVELAEQHADIYCAIGVHPHDAKLFSDEVAELITNLATQSARVIAWGEIGLDFHYDNSPRDVQMKVFRRQVQLARQAKLPVIIHTREAEAETIEVLKSERNNSAFPGIMHCFSGSLSLARQAVELGYYISFSGIVTFKKADELRAIAKELTIDRLLIETDCPFLAPVPFRGKRNQPAYVVEVAGCLAGLHEKTIEEIGKITSSNFAKIFNLELE
jgi:TatD DNase family protein